MKPWKMILFTFIVSIVSIVFFTIYKVYDRHLNLSILVTEKRIIESAMNCYYDDICKGNSVTLGELVHLSYSKEEVNPKTKIYYSLDSYVLRQDNNTYVFVEDK